MSMLFLPPPTRFYYLFYLFFYPNYIFTLFPLPSLLPSSTQPPWFCLSIPEDRLIICAVCLQPAPTYASFLHLSPCGQPAVLPQIPPLALFIYSSISWWRGLWGPSGRPERVCVTSLSEEPYQATQAHMVKYKPQPGNVKSASVTLFFVHRGSSAHM